jgi:hypothetical protein
MDIHSAHPGDRIADLRKDERTHEFHATGPPQTE